MSSNQRQNFRLDYPPLERPNLMVAGITHEVINISERGVKFSVSPQLPLQLNMKITGQIGFKDGKALPIEGLIIRLDMRHGWGVIELTVGIPLSKMMEEQRYLIQKYRS